MSCILCLENNNNLHCYQIILRARWLLIYAIVAANLPIQPKKTFPLAFMNFPSICLYRFDRKCITSYSRCRICNRNSKEPKPNPIRVLQLRFSIKLERWVSLSSLENEWQNPSHCIQSETEESRNSIQHFNTSLEIFVKRYYTGYPFRLGTFNFKTKQNVFNFNVDK